MLTTTMVFLSLASAIAASSSTNGNHSDIMPPDLSQLTYPGGEGVTRIWTRADLGHAPSVLNYEQMWPVIRRLEAGLPITVVAFGDSITKDNGGCFHRDRCAEAVDGRAGRQAGRQAAARVYHGIASRLQWGLIPA